MTPPSPQVATVRAKRISRKVAGACALVLFTPLIAAAPAVANSPSLFDTSSPTAISPVSEAPRNSVGILDQEQINGDEIDGLDNSGRGLSRQDLESKGITPGTQLPYGETGVTFTWPDVEPGQPDHWRPEGQVISFDNVEAGGISFSTTRTMSSSFT